MRIIKKQNSNLCCVVLVSFIASFSPNYVSAQFCLEPPEGIVSWWDGDTISETFAFDIEDGNDGFLKDGVFITPGLVGDAFSFDGIDGWIKIPANPNLNIIGDLTVDLWAMRNSFGGNQQLIYKGLKGVEVPTMITIRFDPNNYLIAGFEQSDGTNVVLTGSQVTDSEFHHYAYVREMGSHALYLDGEVVASDTYSGSPCDSSVAHLIIGAQCQERGVAVDFFDGIIDEVEIFNRALSGQEIRDIYLANSGGKCKETTFSGFNLQKSQAKN